jgi:glycosyltransferase involved in cell wall biosynthesis
VITVSEHARGQIVWRLGIAPEHVAAIHAGIDHARFTPTGPAEAPTERPFVLYPANLWPHKNHERLIAALSRVQGVALVLTGAPSPRLAALENQTRREGVELIHLGYVDDLAPLYRGARAVVFPSLAEGWGAPVIEAMACGCPVATSTEASLEEVVGDAALAFDPSEPDAIAGAIDRITQDEGLRAQLREAGLERAKAFTWERSAQAHVETWEAAARS